MFVSVLDITNEEETAFHIFSTSLLLFPQFKQPVERKLVFRVYWEKLTIPYQKESHSKKSVTWFWTYKTLEQSLNFLYHQRHSIFSSFPSMIEKDFFLAKSAFFQDNLVKATFGLIFNKWTYGNNSTFSDLYSIYLYTSVLSANSGSRSM